VKARRGERIRGERGYLRRIRLALEEATDAAGEDLGDGAVVGGSVGGGG
jgi:hypothetical protein